MKITILFLAFLICIGCTKFQNFDKNQIKFVEVSGSAELEIEPDEILFIIGIGEYWKEEFERKTKFEDYKTKIPISEIEKNLLFNLEEIGIQKDDIIVREVGNFWRYRGKEFLIGKQIELKLSDFNKINQIIEKIDTKGVDYMRIGELENKKITEYRKQVKIEALKAAKDKAEYLLTSIDKEVGDIISIIEVNNENNFWRPQPKMSNITMSSSENSGIENTRKIKLRYEIKAKFEIQNPDT